MLALSRLAEQRIAEAIGRGELTDLPGAGRPLDLSDDPLVPGRLRLAYRMFKNAGCILPEVEALRAIATLARLVDGTSEGDQRQGAVLKLELLRTQLERTHPGRAAATRPPRCRNRILSKLGR